MDLLEDLTETEMLVFQTFLKDTGVTMLDTSADPLDKLKQLSAMAIVSCQHGHIVDHIINKLEGKVLSMAYIRKHKHLYSLSDWPLCGELVHAVKEAKVGKISSSLREVQSKQTDKQTNY